MSAETGDEFLVSGTPDIRRRDFLNVAPVAAAAVGAAVASWPLIDSMNPSADILAQSSTDVDLAPIEQGQRVTVTWQGVPVFIVRRTAEEIARTRADDNNSSLIDLETDAAQVASPEWLIVVGVCTYLGCIRLGQRAGDPQGRYGGWFCPCHGSVYDTSGRVRRRPAPRNLDVPPSIIRSDLRVVIG